MRDAKFLADLELVVQRSKARRYRDVTDPNHPSYHPGYEHIIRTAAAKLRGEVPPDPPTDPQGGPPLTDSTDPLVLAGRQLWQELHLRPMSYKGDQKAEREWLDTFTLRLPCGECRTAWEALVRRNPPDLKDAAAYAWWGHARHNDVNAKLGKTPYPAGKAVRQWGWPTDWLSDPHRPPGRP